MCQHRMRHLYSFIIETSRWTKRVLHALATGVSLNDFARGRGVSIHTVRKQVATMMVKMDCTRQVDLVRAALRVGP